MKTKFILLFIFTVFCIKNAIGQTEEPSTINGVIQSEYPLIPMPDFPNRVYRLTENNTLADLDRVEVKADVQMLTGRWYLIVFNESVSTMRFKSDSIPKFILRIDDGSDPNDYLYLIKGELQKNKRRFMIRGREKDIRNVRTEIECKKIKDGLFEIFMPSITSGEYMFVFNNLNINKASCFGID
jgi:hypothetical protein